jgi:hypothetical protein
MKYCNAKTRVGGKCHHQAGWGTNHPGEGKCKFHGGASTGPKDLTGNKNAVVTGAYESILFTHLDSQEQEVYYAVNVDPIAALEDDIRLITIRELRMMGRIAALKAQADEQGFILTETSETRELPASFYPKPKSFTDKDIERLFNKIAGQDEPDQAAGDQQATGDQQDGPEPDTDEHLVVTARTRKRKSVLDQMQAVEEALTRVQGTKAQLVDKLIKARATKRPDDENRGGLEAFTAALDEATPDVWADETSEDATDG